MNLTTLFKEAMNSILSNKIRSFLTMLGIFIGVGAVIAMMSVGQGAQDSITNSLSGLGTQTLYLTPGNFTQNVRNAQDLGSDQCRRGSYLPAGLCGNRRPLDPAELHDLPEQRQYRECNGHGDRSGLLYGRKL